MCFFCLYSFMCFYTHIFHNNVQSRINTEFFVWKMITKHLPHLPHFTYYYPNYPLTLHMKSAAMYNHKPQPRILFVRWRSMRFL